MTRTPISDSRITVEAWLPFCERMGDIELSNMIRALGYFSTLNTPAENARLAAAKKVKLQRAAAKRKARTER